MRKIKIKDKIVLHPIMAFIILIIITILISGILGTIGMSADYNSINTVRGGVEKTSIMVNSLLSLSGIKLIFSTTVSNFASFAPLIMLIITLIGIGIMDKSGFLESFFSLVTKKSSKYIVTLTLSFLTIIASIIGDISYIIFIPICALFFKYSKRNPKAGIIMAFAGLTCGSGINIFMSSIDASMIGYTKLAAASLDATYIINNSAFLFIMFIMTILMSIMIATITEKVLIPKLGKYEIDDNEEEFYLDKKKKRGLALSLSIGLIYILIFVYNIIPGLPLSGNLLDYSQELYIDKLFGYNSFFNQGFVFVITLFFFLCGLFYGIGAGTIKNNQDVCAFLGHSLDGIGRTLVLIFFAAAFVSIFKATNMGNVLAASIGEVIANMSITGIPLIIVAFLSCIIISIFLPSPITAWSITSGVLVPVFMNSGMSAEFAQLIFRAGECVAFGLTPIMAYFVIYIAFLDKYSEDGNPISLIDSVKDIMPYSGATAFIWITALILLYILGLPMGISTYPVI